MNPIPDRLAPNMNILFVGFNPSLRSGEVGHHYANPNNRFWNILFRSGLTSRKYAPEEDLSLLESGYGFTNIVARPTRGVEDILKEEYAEGRQLLRDKVERYKPKIVCYVGKGVYENYTKRKNVAWGLQPEPVVSGTLDFVAPSSSGLVRMKLEEIVDIYSKLRLLVEEH